MLRRYKAILFDLDGTLVSTAHLWERFLPEIVLELGYGDEKTREDLIRAGREGKDPVLTVLPHLSREEISRIYAEARKRILNHLNEIKPIFSREELLTIIDGKPTGIVTMSHSLFAKKVLKAVGIKDLFDTIVGSDLFENPKPHPEPLLKGIEFLGEGRVAYVGDTKGDEEAAIAAGLDFYHVRAVKRYVQGHYL